MNNYRVTQRGKIVFSILIFAFITLMYFLISDFNSSNVEKLPDTNINEKIEKEVFETEEVQETEEIKKSDLEKTIVYDENDIKILKDSMVSIFYESNEYYVPEKYFSELLNFLNVALEYDNEDITIEGNVNLKYGKEDYQDILRGIETGYDRALVIKNYFLENGIKEDRIFIVNNGDSNPLNIDESYESLKLNRRSDIFFTEYKILELTTK